MTIEERRAAVRHVFLKQLAVDLLKAMGFADSEIHEEYQVRVRGLKNFIVDVVGLKHGKSVAVEVGDCDAKKLMTLEGLFDEVIWLPYIGSRSFDRDEARKTYLAGLEDECSQLRTRVAFLENELRWTRSKLDEILNHLGKV